MKVLPTQPGDNHGNRKNSGSKRHQQGHREPFHKDSSAKNARKGDYALSHLINLKSCHDQKITIGTMRVGMNVTKRARFIVTSFLPNLRPITIPATTA
jgi:hypothetical protein